MTRSKKCQILLVIQKFCQNFESTLCVTYILFHITEWSKVGISNTDLNFDLVYYFAGTIFSSQRRFSET